MSPPDNKSSELPATDNGGEKEEEEDWRSKEEEIEDKEAGDAFPHDAPASFGSKPGGLKEEMETSEREESEGKEAEGSNNETETTSETSGG